MHSLIPSLAKALLVELVALEQIAQRQRDKVEYQHQQRLVFEWQQNAVAAALLAFKGVVAHSAGAGTADVVALGGGAEHIFVAGIVGAPAQVYVLKVGKKVLVKAADLVQNAFAVQRCAAAGRKDTLLLCVAAGAAAIAGLAGKAHPCHIVPGIIGQFPLKVPDHQALHRKNFGVGIGGAQKLGQPLRLGKGVVVEQHHIFALRPGNALIHCVGKAGVAPVFDQGKVGAGAVAARLRKTFIGGTVVHHDQVKILLSLGVDGLDGVLQPALAVDVWDNDGRFYHKSYSCFRQLQREYIILSQKCKPLG